jgi:hypothetical protein
MSAPAIVIPAFNRPHSLSRLLGSLERASIPDGTPLILSIDYGGDKGGEVRLVAERFKWNHGRKLIIDQGRRLGLIGNVFFCGELSQSVGPIILLEDDLTVSPPFYEYARRSLDYYAEDERIAGISLNALWFNGYRRWPFTPYLDGSDYFFLQVPWFQGQLYSQRQWKRFAEWRNLSNEPPEKALELHPMFDSFPATDWFPLKTRYLVETGRYYAFPRQSLSANHGDPGTHFAQPTGFFQSPLQNYLGRFRMGGLDESYSVYDSYQEMVPDCLNRLTDQLADYDYSIDLNATRNMDAIATEFVLTTRICEKPLFSYGMKMRPLIANVVEQVSGTGISFCRPTDVKRGRIAQLATDRRLNAYHWRGSPGLKTRIFHRLLGSLTKLDKD